MVANREQAVKTSLLLLPDRFCERDLYVSLFIIHCSYLPLALALTLALTLVLTLEFNLTLTLTLFLNQTLTLAPTLTLRQTLILFSS